MKNKLLMMAFSVPFFLVAQKATSPKTKLPVVGEPVLVPFQTSVINDSKQKDSGVLTPVFNGSQGLKRQELPYGFVLLGNTTYDLQTNASMGRRIVLLPNGNVSAVWTTSKEKSTTFTDRGIGYNSFDGTSWYTPQIPTPRLEASTRTGWPSIGIIGSNEWVMGHNANDGGFVKSTNASFGSNTWTTGPALLKQTDRRPIWGRIMNNGNYFHCISNYADSSAAGEKPAPTINGVKAPWTYSRSTDGGNTWSTQHIMLPGYDGSRYINGGGDNYAIDVRDSIVVIVSAGNFEDVAIWKSTDNGLTFTKTIIDSFKYAPYSSKKLMLDTPIICDGSLDVIIDANGKVHAFWGTLTVMDADSNDQFFTIFPKSTSIAYWNEYTQSRGFIVNGSDFDKDANNNYDIKIGTWSSLATGQTLPKDQGAEIPSIARLGSTGLLHMPSVGLDANGVIYVTFSAPLEENVDINGSSNYRDIILMCSKDSGATWSKPMDISKNINKYDKNKNPIFMEEEFACIARKVNGFVHVVFQADELPGTNLQNNSPAANNHPISDFGNDIFYTAIPVSKILDGSIDNTPLGIDEVASSREIFIVSQNFPNPFSNNSEVIVWLENASDVTLEITNMQGQVVGTQTYDNLVAGNHKLTMNGEGLSSGVYFYTLRTSTNSATQKMMIQH